MKKVPLTLGELLTSILSDYNIKYYIPYHEVLVHKLVELNLIQ
jgi:hypothetical protein